ncbi:MULTISPECIES: glycosyltransferase [unclassified Herbaspirillum]|uniref:glycosyltransferase n=1 Tax=unclassified Herbaspirillum TaxID=2624150 RepID=UPI000E2EEEB4|nr:MULTISPECIES: glycosyltransferase [unclassified Herbaspirillum]RFB73072.1 glycosyltransferase [Herbaspirillum sp. 3R-3a1]TFI11120.1 glycosyltransferase [Herbaspirillum sp. 3R11]TFI17028.1 glycosyltransferase [Herbaspirillum sp. 3R-11]TFI31106.1 glycosyltransferase [Herbaspirillum sp. 3C11]
MIGVVIPVHNEEDYLHACLASMQLAIAHPGLPDEEVRVLAVLDACSDGSGGIAQGMNIEFLSIDSHNVGLARAAGAAALMQAGARWLAFTDADSVVAPAWLATQLALAVQDQADAVCGTVAVDDWSAHGERASFLRRHFRATYVDQDQHRHIHGANLGVSTAAYRLAGGFAALACGEDVALVQALLACGARISWSAAPRVTTSSRIASHARGGFGDTLSAVAMTAP